jgi:diadenosine tetraphosphate (Ap4A) HIT family hydrolase
MRAEVVIPKTDAQTLSAEDLKRITDFFSILIKIDERLKAKGNLKNEKK